MNFVWFQEFIPINVQNTVIRVRLLRKLLDSVVQRGVIADSFEDTELVCLDTNQPISRVSTIFSNQLFISPAQYWVVDKN